ncbi:hypothetical protein GSI_14929 [Ganoderma sinense ZZ0214-1]|uniref:Uncharacterized protein n=1 Tax=Ganoderma sinense ZZ0214-1 TaxID=1077348 RepID=A0A2G8RQ34_9APHY|nr:hypothetical protein GSI_14929 [Ganoderma sinense ZZ0214-1]
MSSNVVEGSLPQQTLPGAYPKANGPPRLSGALMRGAQRLTDIFEIRTATLKADYEERIRALTAQRDALLAASQGQPFQGSTKLADGSEMEALHSERSMFLRERADRERDRMAWDRERAEWNKERARAQEERASWNEERLLVEAERVRLDEERTRGNVEGTRWEETNLLLTRERASLLEERNQWLRVRRDLEDELSRVRHELQVTKVGYGTLQEQLALKNASVMALETRVRQLEEAGALGVRPHADADGTEDQQEVFDPLDYIRSPARSTTLATISTQSSTLSVKSPSLDPVSTQLARPAPSPPAVTFLLDCPPSPTKANIASGICDDSLTTDVPTLVEGSDVHSQSATSVMVTPPRRLVIRIPPSGGKTRKSLKPPPPQLTAEERRSIVFVPRRPDSDDDNDELDAASDPARTVQHP